jgi:phosphoglycolate phosphatase-like HAD superfamily hydrolase
VRPPVVFDFDGVVCDSTEECLVTSWNAWTAWSGGRRFVDSPRAVPKGPAGHFRRLRLYVRGAGEYLAVYRCLEEGRRVRRQADFEAAVRRCRRDLKPFARVFFAMRRRLRRRDLPRWTALHPVHGRVLSVLRRLARERRLYIVTLKDRRSVELILASHGLSLPPSRILDQSVIASKWDGLRRVLAATGAAARDVLFVDDNVTHLAEPRRRGIACRLAVWGYTTPEHRRAARRMGIPLLRLDKLSKSVR